MPLLNQLGIHFQHLCPHVHEQNDKIERKHRHVVETRLTTLAQATMPLKYWWVAFCSAVYLINRLPTPTLYMQSPFEIVHHKRPDYEQLRVFGSACFPCLWPYNKYKLQFRSSKCVFIGYNSAHKGYRCLHSSGKIYLARNVVINEHEFPYSSLFKINPSKDSLSSCSDLVQQVHVGGLFHLPIAYSQYQTRLIHQLFLHPMILYLTI